MCGKILLLAGFLWTATAQAQVPIPAGHTNKEEQLIWNKWDTENFVIFSVNYEQGIYLYENLENVKKWLLNRWGIPNHTLTTRCKVVAVPSKELLSRLFGLSESHAEAKEENGKIIEVSAWILLEGNPPDTIPPPVTLAVIKSIEIEHQIKFGLWTQRAMVVLNTSLSSVRKDMMMVTVKESVPPDFTATEIFDATEKDWLSWKKEKKDIYDAQAAALLLLIRKEFGQDNLHAFWRSKDIKTLGFQDLNQFNSTYHRYMFYLSEDLQNNKTPDSYLQIIPKQNK